MGNGEGVIKNKRIWDIRREPPRNPPEPWDHGSVFHRNDLRSMLDKTAADDIRGFFQDQ